MAEGDGMARVGVRELRQNLSVYLDRVKAGETLEVTEHGRVVAQLAPNPAAAAGVLERLIADGLAVRPASTGRTLPLPPAAVDRAISDVLREMRDEER
jgi:prevent-host-death family protein